MARAYETGQHPRTFEREIRKVVRLNYWLYLPEGYGEADGPWPLMLFLHGGGEKGDDLDLVLKHGPPKLISEGTQFPFIVASPQCPGDSRWPAQIEALHALLDDLESEYDIDPDRVYVTGMSMGGYGTWALGCDRPGRFAALVPICGGGDRWRAKVLKEVPVWVVHGGKDTVVPPECSEEMVAALRKAGAEPRHTVYPEAGHDSWTETYENDELYEWLLAQHRA
jgi:predicted peptidase